MIKNSAYFLLLLLCCCACKMLSLESPQRLDLRSKPKSSPETNQRIADSNSRQDNKLDNNKQIITDVSISYIKINNIALPLIRYKAPNVDLYLSYDACNEQKKCLQGIILSSPHTLTMMPSGKVSFRYRSCFLSSTAKTSNDNCNAWQVITTRYHLDEKANPQLKALLVTQETLTDKLQLLSKAIFNNIKSLDAVYGHCDDSNYKKFLSPKIKADIASLSKLTQQQITSAVTIGGDKKVNDLFDELKKSSTTTIIHHGPRYDLYLKDSAKAILFATSTLALVMSIKSIFDWHQYLKRSTTVEYKGRQYTLQQASTGNYWNNEELNKKMDIEEGNGSQEVKFVQDPITRKLYLQKESSKNNGQLLTSNGDLIECCIENIENIKYSKLGPILGDGLAKGASDKSSFLEETQERLQEEYKEELRPKLDPLRQAGGSLGSEALVHTIKTTTSLAGVIVGLHYLLGSGNKKFLLADSSHKALHDPCFQLLNAAKQFEDNYKQAQAFRNKLLTTKIKIAMFLKI